MRDTYLSERFILPVHQLWKWIRARGTKSLPAFLRRAQNVSGANKRHYYISRCNTFGNNPDYLLSVAVNGPVTIVRPDGSPIVVTLCTKGRPELLLATVIVKSLCAYVF
jgi:hypothetical protein